MASLRKVNCVATWTALPDLRAGEVSILNRTGAALELRYAGETSAGQSITISDGGSANLPVTANAKEIEAQGTAGTSTIHLIITP
jgi:hypothetical protein